jgi:hypothetical protein
MFSDLGDHALYITGIPMSKYNLSSPDKSYEKYIQKQIWHWANEELPVRYNILETSKLNSQQKNRTKFSLTFL